LRQVVNPNSILVEALDRLNLPGAKSSSTIRPMSLTAKTALAAVFFYSFASTLVKADSATLVERLGYKPTDKLLIINGDDTGMCHAANTATIDSLERGLMTSATIMVPCPWFTEIARYAKANPGKDFGVHLCHTSEWQVYRWGPVASRDNVPGLVDNEGYLWRSVPEVYQHATPGEALIEARAQVRKALDAGIDVTHLDTHMGALNFDPRYVQIYLQLGKEFDLPLRMPSQVTAARFGFTNLRKQFAAKGIVFPDYLIYDELDEEKGGVKQFWLKTLRNLKPGVTELFIHAAKPTEELRHITNSWKIRSEEYEVFTNDENVRKLVKELGIIRIGYRPLRDLQRFKGK